MTQKEISLSRQRTGVRGGRRCQICTGCGLCPGVAREDTLKTVILTQDLLNGSGFSLENEDGLRLIAADVGTTTIAMELYRADGSVEDSYVCVNPQTVYGADVLSRITAASDPAKLNEMTDMVRSALTSGAERFLKCLGDGESAVMVIAANTVMSYLLMGWDPMELGHAPFLAMHLEGARFSLSAGSEELPCLLLPGFSTFVGGDLLAGAYACDMTGRSDLTLLVDLGTNGEILLGNQSEILATATAAGPAFEGGPNRGIFGADLVRLAAKLLEAGGMDKTGLLCDAYFERGVRIGNVTLTKESIRSLQLAKAAIHAGIQILIRKKGISVKEIDRVILGGGFGYFLNPADAVNIGLLPASLEDRTRAGGNTALAGAKRLGGNLLRRDFWKSGDLWTPDACVRVINLAKEPEFPDSYLESMAFCKLD